MSSVEIPLVSICSITYNHEPYIRQCLDGMLSQKTNFPFEIIINDDCSTDGTTEIIKEYVAKYPNIIRPIFHEENQYSKGVRGMFANFCFPKARGKYIALCEGDDYWTDPLKLQKQVDFLEEHPSFVLTTHRFTINKDNKIVKIGPDDFREVILLNHLLKGDWTIGTLTIVFKKSAIDVSKCQKLKICVDYSLYYFLLSTGNGYSFNDIMAVYRLHEGGVWTSKSIDEKRLFSFNARLALYEVEPCKEAATFLLALFKDDFGASLVLKNRKLFYNIFNAISNEFGACFTLKLLFGRIIPYLKR